MTLVDDILKLKREKKAVILAHNYQRPEIQDIADYVGDSIELSRRAKEEKDAKIIVFAAVNFMAESAAILNPEKKVLLPCMGSRCSMVQMLPAEQLKIWKQRYPNTPVVLYVNTLAEAKAECDVCCTSANAIKIVETLDGETILFGPDRNLAEYVQEKTGKKVIPIPPQGFCPTHILFMKEDIMAQRQAHPDAVVAVHPECSKEVREIADFIGSTSQICRYSNILSVKKFIIGTEVGILHKLRKENPDKQFLPAYGGATCNAMKLTTLERLYHSLKEEQNPVSVPKSIAKKAKKALNKMFALTE
ncbi:MAG: quinolinate synthase NadA [Candidatus Bathyarchaeota archaeon]|nr:quinolinate synthase NadA [Candidatus Bathyarchaeota archaeon]MDH5495099.1 quinolinate synthase NadA [Candidatus Bathyarchaeota archaeon]